MLSFAIIVFREVLEIALVLSVLVVATKGLQSRGRWIGFGIALGVLGSVGVALGAEQISNAMEGMGQEVFNASVLIFAAILISSTVVWMKGHSRQMVTQLKSIGQEVTSGRRPLSILALVMALSVLRDGAEVVLLAHGVLASGQSIMQILLGSLLGIVAGTVVGLCMYWGIIRAASRYIFTVTSWMLIALSAGMVSQAVGFLSAAGIVPEIVYPLWDSSWLVSDQGMLGQTLHVLIGYTARPSAAQILCYIAVVLLTAGALKMIGGQISKGRMAAAVVAVLAVFISLFSIDSAYAVDKIYSPIVDGGEFELETKGKFEVDDRDEKDNKYKQYIGAGYGFTDRLFVEIYGIFEKEPQGSTKFEEYELETRYQLFEQGEYWLDAGLYLALETDEDFDDYAVEAKVLLEKPVGDFVHNANIIFERGVFDGGEDVKLETAWRSYYRLNQYFEPGVELQSEFGAIDEIPSYDKQEHLIGPAVYGALPGGFGYELAGLFGISSEAPDFVLRWVLEYEMYF